MIDIEIAIEDLEHMLSKFNKDNTGYVEWHSYANAVTTAKKALEKQIPNKPMMMQAREPEYMCKCGAKYYCYIRKIADKYCSNCGQKLDWSDIEEEVYCGECEHYIYAEQRVNGKERVCEMLGYKVNANEIANKCKDFKDVEE